MAHQPKQSERGAALKRIKADPVARSGTGLLSAYKAKRDFAASPEPRGKRAGKSGYRFCVQKHDARRLHYDLRLELDGVLKSWAVTRGPSLVAGDKRLAVHTEDHPLDYLTFEGVIPAGEYGGGTMIVWDQGTWIPLSDPHKGYAKGHLDFALKGERLTGRWHLVRMRSRAKDTKEQWLLFKGDDAFARTGTEPVITEEHTTSIISGQTNADLSALGSPRRDHASRAKAKSKGQPAPDLKGAPSVRKGLLPVFLEPSLAALSDKAPSGPSWLHEIKYDGYRIQARIDGRKIKLLTRKGLDWTQRFMPVADALRQLKLESALLDGELVVEDEAGLSNFSGLQADLKAGRTDRLVYYAFDLLYLDGHDLTRVPLLERKRLLAGLLPAVPDGVIRYSAHIEGNGSPMARHACRLGLEGIVSKQGDKPYIAGRGTHWLKTKCSERQEFVIAGYVPSTTSSRAVGSLVLGTLDAGEFVHVGRVGTGFTAETAVSLWRELDAIKCASPPFAKKPSTEAARGVRWVEPRFVAEIELRGWTADGLLRHAAFKGLRDDKEAADVAREPAKAARRLQPSRIHLTHPDRVLWPDVGLTKQGLAEFYIDTADWVLPHVVGRPLSLLRCPSGTGGACFFQKHAWSGMGEAVRRKALGGEEVLFIKDLNGLMALVQAGCLEIHPWGSRIALVEKPDRLTMDLDPGEDVPWSTLVEAACEVRERLRAAGLESFVKTTGGKGLHVVAPLRPKASWAALKNFAQGIAQEMAAESPGRFTATMAKHARRGRIFVDYLRNGRGATSVAAYSTRARAGAPVSTPLAWDELGSVSPNHFTVENLPRRLRHLRIDPWAGFSDVEQALASVRRKPAKRS